MLKSNLMYLSPSEKSWLPWLGATGKLKMGWSCLINRNRYAVIEKLFEGVVETRKNILIDWTNYRWQFLAKLAQRFADLNLQSSLELEQHEIKQQLTHMLQSNQEFSELFIINTSGQVIESSYQPHVGKSDLAPQAVTEGSKSPFLHGPYVDELTNTIGKTCSQFHDSVTLMFYQPITKDNQITGILCGRVPNDVMSDLIQREAGHVFPESGDNYIFMVKSNFDPSIQPGIALSRSRFEDDSFSGGENLLQGVNTQFGQVKIKKHTEFEILFTNPATNELHPGVRETMRNGRNVYVKYPGYSDYRYIPVIGAGTTFQLPGSPDKWGMMCEGDLEEVYWFRSVSYKFIRNSTLCLLFFAGIIGLMSSLLNFSSTILVATIILAIVSSFAFLYQQNIKPIAQRFRRKSAFFMGIAECNKPLTSSINPAEMERDETGELTRWINSFVDRTAASTEAVLSVAEEVSSSAHHLSELTESVTESSTAQNCSANLTGKEVEQLIDNIGHISNQAIATQETSKTASTLSSDGSQLVQEIAEEMSNIANLVVDSSKVVHQLQERSNSISGILKVISDIAEQTNLLALNATIEAARAGEHGRGFAVVADEVKKLSERTSASTTEITQMINAILSETSEVSHKMEACNEQVQKGETLMQQAASSLTQINQGAHSAFDMVQEIVQLTQAQLKAGHTISNNVDMITRSAEQNSLNAIHSADSAHNLALLGSQLQYAVKLISG